MTEKELVTAIHKSTYNANKDYADWAGAWLSKYGVEGFLVGRLADGIMSAKNSQRPPTWLTLETSFSELLANQGKKPKGPRSEYMKDTNRLDIALYYGESLSHAIEVKRIWSQKCFDDLGRLCDLVKHCGKNAGGTLKCGVFVLPIEAKVKKDLAPQECLDESFGLRERECEEYLKKYKGIRVPSFSRGTKVLGYYLISEDQKAVFSSLCVVIK